MARPLPTTKAQVSGHKFLLRRVEHGLVLGDVRMIHDPLARRRRALLFGLLAVVFLALGSGLLAWMQPNPRPGEASIVRSRQGQLFVSVDQAYHPVANLASARIIAGTPAEPAAIGDEYLAQAELGSPVGISDAPGYLAPPPSPPRADWAACHTGTAEGAVSSPTTIGSESAAPGEVVVLAQSPHAAFGPERAAVARSEGKHWLLTTEGRVLLPETSSTQGRVLRRALGITPDTPVWDVPTQFLGAFTEQPPLSFPAQPPEVVDTGQGWWARTEAGVTELSTVQAEMLAGYGATTTTATPQEIAALADAPPNFNLPSSAFDFHRAEHGWLCADSTGGAAAVDQEPGTVALAGQAAADRFGGLQTGGVGVDSGHGYHVVSATGQRHPVADAATLEALGTGVGANVPWSILRLLPEASPLSRAEALGQHS